MPNPTGKGKNKVVEDEETLFADFLTARGGEEREYIQVKNSEQLLNIIEIYREQMEHDALFWFEDQQN